MDSRNLEFQIRNIKTVNNTELVGLDRLESFSYESFSVSCCACTDVLLFFSLQRMSLFIVPTGFILVLIFHLAIGDRQPTVKSSEKDKSGATLSQTLISVKQLDAQKDTGNMTNSQFSHIPARQYCQCKGTISDKTFCVFSALEASNDIPRKVPFSANHIREHNPSFLRTWKDWLKCPQFYKVENECYLCIL